MKKHPIREKIQYLFDNIMAGGIVPLLGLVVFIAIILVFCFGALTVAVKGSGNLEDGIWLSFIHLLDQGTFTTLETDNKAYILIMIIATFSGILIFSTTVGIVSTLLEAKLHSLQRGKAKVVETNHTVIIGFDENIFVLLNELIIANRNRKGACILVVDEKDSVTMYEQIHGHIPKTHGTRIICRSGNPLDLYVLKKYSLETCRAIIINCDNDFFAIKQLLALEKYFKEAETYNENIHIVVPVNDGKNVTAAQSTGGTMTEIVYIKNYLARIIAHTCRHPGLSQVLTDFFDFNGNEIYYEKFNKLLGKTFGDILNLFENSTVLGIEKNNQALLNPPIDTLYEEGDSIIHLAEDNNKVNLNLDAVSLIDIPKATMIDSVTSEKRKNILIIDSNELLPAILEEYNKYALPNSVVCIAVENTEDINLDNRDTNNLNVKLIKADVCNKNELEKLFDIALYDVVLLLCDLQEDAEKVDEKIILSLIHLRDIRQSRNLKCSIVSQMRSGKNQELANSSDVSDFVVGSSITALIMAQIAENRQLASIYEELLDEGGSEIYMKKVISYVEPGKPVSIASLVEIGKTRRELVFGYKKYTGDIFEIKTNLPKSEIVTFGEKDELIMIAED